MARFTGGGGDDGTTDDTTRSSQRGRDRLREGSDSQVQDDEDTQTQDSTSNGATGGQRSQDTGDGGTGGSFSDQPEERVDLAPEEGSQEAREQREQREQRGAVAEQTDVETTEILRTEQTETGISYELTPRARVTRQTDLESGDIRRLERTQDGVRPVLTDDARRERAADQALEQFRSDQRPARTGLNPGRAQGSLAREVSRDDLNIELTGQRGASVQLQDDFVRGIQPRDRDETPRPREGFVPGFGSDTPEEVAVETSRQRQRRDADGADGAFGYVQDLYEESRENVSPFARMSLDDPDALQARQEKEQGMFETAEGAFNFDGDIEGDDAFISGEEALATLGVVGDVTGQAITDFGTQFREATTSAGGPSIFSAGSFGNEDTFDSAVEEATGGQVDGPPLGEPLGEVPGNLVAGTIEFGGAAVSAGAQAPYSFSQDIESLAMGDEIPTGVQGGAGATVERFGQSQVEAVEQYPVSTTLGFGLPAVAGVPAGVRGFRATRGTGGRSVRLSEITSERGAQGDLPRFETRPTEPTRRAVGEVQRRAADQPEVVQEAAGADQVLYHTTENPLSRDLTVGEGTSELPGLFTSPDASPLRLDVSASQGSRRFGLGDWSTTPEQVAGFESPRIAGMPDAASGAGYGVRRGGRVQETGLSRAEANRIVAERGGERVPDPGTSGYEFLTQQAEPGTAYVRGRGSRTSELEAIFPPESRFGATERLGVEMPSGETVPMDIFRQGAQPARPAGQTTPGAVSGAEIGSTYSAFGQVQGQPTFTPTPTFGSLGGAGSGLSATSTPRGSVEASPSTTSSRLSDVENTVSGAATQFGETMSEAFSSQPTSTPGGAGSSAATSSPTSDPSGLFTDSPSGSPSGTGSTPPSRNPPGDPTGIFTAPPSRGPPSTPPGSPPSGSDPSRPGNPFFPGDPAGQPRATYDFDVNDRDDDERDELLPFGSTYENPIASGSAFLLGELPEVDDGDNLFGF